jgi:hypothetical protein
MEKVPLPFFLIPPTIEDFKKTVDFSLEWNWANGAADLSPNNGKK